MIKSLTVMFAGAVWNIVNGRLLLNYDKSVQATSSKDIPGHIVKADKNWPGVLGK